MKSIEPTGRLVRQSRSIAAACSLLAAWLLVNWCITVRWPAPTSPTMLFLPAADTVIGLALIALFAPSRNWSPLTLSHVCAIALIVVRVTRVADGVCHRYLDRPFHVAADLSLVPEFLRLARSTLGPGSFVLALVVFVLTTLVLYCLLAASLRRLASVVVEPRFGDTYLLCAGAFAVLGAIALPSSSAFASSIAPRGLDEIERLLETRGLFDEPQRAVTRRMFNDDFERGQKRLISASAPLRRSNQPDIHVILVEAYGHTAQQSPFYREWLSPAYQAFAETVKLAGFSMCTGFVHSTVYGGNSWLTHATIESATPINDQFEYGLLLEKNSMTSLAKALSAVGYRTVSVKPGTTRPAPQTRIYGFAREYTAPDFGYRGPTYAWAPMPDQFVLQRIADLELAHRSKPLFLEYALVTSHFPWSSQPQWVDDWSMLGDGSFFRKQPPLVFEKPVGPWPAQVVGYATSIVYDLRATSEFIARDVRGDALILLLGDHQPVGPVAGEASRDTPMHVLSRRPEWLAPFEQHGCVAGMFGDTTQTMYGMEDLGPELLKALSNISAREIQQ